MSLNPFKKTIGLDISDSKIRFIQLNKSHKKAAAIDAFGEVTVPRDLIKSGDITDRTQVIKLITGMLEKPAYGKVSTKFINSALPEKRTFIKTVTFPNVPIEELPGAVGWGVEQNIPVTLKNVYYDWFMLNDGKPNDQDKLSAMVSVAPRELTDQYTSLIKEAGLTPIGLENESTAIARCLLDQHLPKPPSMFIIDLGRSRTNIMMYSNGAIQFAESVDVSGREMTEAVAHKMNMTYEDAEKAKIITGLDSKKSRGSVRAILEPIVLRLISKIEEGVYFYQHYIAPEQKIESLLLTGSVSRMQGVPEYLEEKLQRPVTIGNPAINLSIPKNKKKSLNVDFISYSTAIGLGLKNF